jgi:antitoxin FitA
MASLVIRQIPESVKTKLKERAARHGRSMEEEVRSILKAAAAEQEEEGPNFLQALHEAFAPFGGFEFERIQEPVREPPDFS